MSMNKTFLFLVVLGIGVHAWAAPPEQLPVLLADAQKASEGCKKWMEGTKPLVEMDESGEHLKDKATAIKLLKNLEQGTTPPEFQKVYGFVVRRGEKLTTEDISKIHAALDCSPTMSSFVNYRRVIKDVSHLQFDETEKQALIQQLKEHLKRETAAENNLINLMMNITLMEEMLKSNLINAPKSVTASLQSTKKKGERIVSDLKRPESNRSLIKFYVNEMRRTDMLRKDLSHILGKL